MDKNEKAFPQQGQQTGMDLRDWFAGQFLQGYVASYAGCESRVDILHCAKIAYNAADAMLAEKAGRDE